MKLFWLHDYFYFKIFNTKLPLSICQCSNYSMNKNYFLCMATSNPKFDNLLQNKSFSLCKIGKSHSTIWVSRKSVATTSQYSIKFENQASNENQPYLKLEVLESELTTFVITGSHLWALIGVLCSSGMISIWSDE